MKKALLALAALLLVAIVGAVFWLRGNLDSLLKHAIESQGSTMTQTKVNVGGVDIQPGDGHGVIRDLTIGNPKGFKTAHALKVAEIEVAIDIASVTQDVVTIRKIAIIAPDVIYEKGEVMTNFDALQKHIAESLGPGERSSGGKKLIVEELTIRSARAQASAAFMGGKTVVVPLPDITLRNVGKAKGGITPGELGNEIAKALKGRLASGVNFNTLAKSAGAVLDKTGGSIKGLFR